MAARGDVVTLAGVGYVNGQLVLLSLRSRLVSGSSLLGWYGAATDGNNEERNEQNSTHSEPPWEEGLGDQASRVAIVAPVENLNKTGRSLRTALPYFEATARQRARLRCPHLKAENRTLKIVTVTNKAARSDIQLAQEVLQRMPGDASLHDIAQELEFLAAIRDGLAEFDANKDSISIERVDQRLPSWSVTIGRHRRGRQKRKAGDSLKPPASSPNA